jgi:predicted aspartyl protease
MKDIFGPHGVKTFGTFVAASLAASGPIGHHRANHMHEWAVLPGPVHQGVVMPGLNAQEVELPGNGQPSESLAGGAQKNAVLPGNIHEKRVLLPGGGDCVNQPAGIAPLHIRGDQAFISLPINRSSVNMLLDTGDFVTALTPEASRRLALPASSRPRIQMTGLTGAYEASVVDAENVQFVGRDLKNLSFPVLPEGEFAPSEHTDGLFGANYLSAYDVDMDFAGKQLSFYGTANTCGWSGPRWTATAVKYFATNIGYHLLLIPIRVNGVELNALIDTGSEETSITAAAAATLGVTKAQTRHDQDVNESGLGVTSSRLHVFDSIQIGSTTFQRPKLAVDDGPSIQQEQNISSASPQQPGVTHKLAAVLGPNPANKQEMIVTFQRHAMFSGHGQLDVILGADFMFKKKFYLAYHQNAVYIN